MKDNDDIHKATMAAHNTQQLLESGDQWCQRRNNPNRHFYLYAKNHYQQDNYLEDLRTIMANYSNIQREFVQDRYIVEKLLRLVHLHVGDQQQFVKFVSSFFDVQSDSLVHQVVKASLVVLMFAEVKDIYYELGEPDPAVLPVTNKPKEE
jgi:hypothetical protein